MSFYYDVHPTTNMTAKVVANYQSDPLVLRDFFEGQYQTNVEPVSFVEVTSDFWPNYTLNVMAQPHLVDFFETVERCRSQADPACARKWATTPVYYESESSIGYFRRAFSSTNSLFYLTNFSLTRSACYRDHQWHPARLLGSRVDTFHQFTMPETFFGWLNVTPNVGGRLTYYSEWTARKSTPTQQLRAVFNTGVDVSFKASRFIRDVESSFLDVHELRHIIEPEVDYAYVPSPTRSPSQVPQFDYQSPSLRFAAD